MKKSSISIAGDLLISEYDGMEYTNFTYGPNGEPVGFSFSDPETNESFGYYYYLKNIQGDIIGLIDFKGEIECTYSYDAWGKFLGAYDENGNAITHPNSAALSNPLRYRGYYYDDETGLYYLNSRYYNPEWGTFISADTVEVATASPEEPLYDKSLYAYCDNNPIARIDTSGYFWETALDVVSLAISVADVIEHPNEALAWVGLAGDVIDLLPFATGIGESVKIVRRTVDVSDKVADTVKIENKLHRPYIRKSTREAVVAAAKRAPDGSFLDANTLTPIKGKYDLGHVYGHEFWRERDKAMQLGWTQKQFNNYMNNPSFYQIENPIFNRSHIFEMR